MATPEEEAVEAHEKIVRDAITGAPFARKLGIDCEPVAPDRVVMRLPRTPDLGPGVRGADGKHIARALVTDERS